MAALEDKLLDGPNVGYCSSSEGEDDGCFDIGKSAAASTGGTSQTGPKGVLADYERFQCAQLTQKAAKDEQLLKVANRFALEHKPTDEEEDVDELEKIRQRRLAQLKGMARGRILEVPDRFEFLSLLERESGYLLFMHIYSDGREQSERLNDALLELMGRVAREKTPAKFYKVQTKVLGTSDRFSRDALPALQVYRDEQLIGNFIRLTCELGDDYDGGHLFRFLKRNAIPLELTDE